MGSPLPGDSYENRVEQGLKCLIFSLCVQFFTHNPNHPIEIQSCSLEYSISLMSVSLPSLSFPGIEIER